MYCYVLTWVGGKSLSANEDCNIAGVILYIFLYLYIKYNYNVCIYNCGSGVFVKPIALLVRRA